MANANPNEITEAFADVIAKRLQSATKDQVADMFDLMFGKSLERLVKVGGIKQEKTKEKKSEEKKPDVAPKEASPSPAEAAKPPPLPSNAPEEPASKLQKVEKPVIIGGFSEDAIKNLKKILPESLSDALKNLNTNIGGLSKLLKDLGAPGMGKGFGMGVLGVLGTIFSLFMLLDSIKDSGPFKGLKLLIGKLSLEAVTLPFRIFFNTLKALKDNFFKKVDMLKKIAPEAMEEIAKKSDEIVKGFKGKIAEKVDKILGPITRFFSNIYNKITGFIGGIFNTIKTKIFGIFGKEAAEVGTKAATTVAEAGAKAGGGGLFKTLLTGIGKAIRVLPIIGGLFSVYSAWTRFKSGDLLGGGIDVISAICDLVSPFFPPLKFVSLGLGAINAFLDFKAGGSDVAGGKAKPKGEMIWGWLKNLGKWFVEKLKLVPGVSDIIEGTKLIFEGKAEEGFERLPIIGDLIRAFKDPAKEFAAGNVIAAGLMSPIKLLMDVIVNSFTGIIDGIKVFLKKVLKYVPGALIPDSMEQWMKEPEAPKAESPKETKKEQATKTVEKPKDALIDPTGGLVVSSPREGELFQLSKNDGIAAGPWTNKTDVNVSVDNKILSEVAKNTKMTNEGLLQLANGFMTLAKQLGVFADKAVTKGGTTVNNIMNSQSEQESSADIVRRIGATPITQLRQSLAQGYNPV